MPKSSESIMAVRGLTKVFRGGVFRPRYTVAVKDVSFEIRSGEIVSLIGESGSGKTTVGKLILKLLKPTGADMLRGRDIEQIRDRQELRNTTRGPGHIPGSFATFNPVRVDRNL